MLDYLNEGVVDGLLNECIRHYFFPSKAKEAKKQKNIMPDLSLGTVMPFTIPVELPGVELWWWLDYTWTSQIGHLQLWLHWLPREEMTEMGFQWQKIILI